MSPTATATGTASDFIAQVRAKLLQVRRDVMTEAAHAMDESLQAGEDAAHMKIEMSTTPTGDRRAARGEGHPGRIETGNFIDDFTHDLNPIGEDEIQGRFGWIGEDGTPYYYDVQEKGADEHETTIAGVHALLDASEVAKTQFKKALTDYVRSEFK